MIACIAAWFVALIALLELDCPIESMRFEFIGELLKRSTFWNEYKLYGSIWGDQEITVLGESLRETRDCDEKQTFEEQSEISRVLVSRLNAKLNSNHP